MIRLKRLLAVLLASALLVPSGIVAFAEDVDPGGVGNGTTANGNSQNNDQYVAPPAGAPYTNYIGGSVGDAWEISVYAESIGVNGASFMMYGPNTQREIDPALLNMMEWGDSRGQKNSTNRTGQNLKYKNPESPVWSNRSAIVGWAQTDGQLDRFIFERLKQQGEINQSQYEVLCDTAKFITSGEELTDAELQEKLESGELVDFTIAMEPILPYKIKTTTVLPGGVTMGGIVFDLDKRQELYSNWFAVVGVNGLHNMLTWLSNPFIDFNVAAGEHNCHHDWKDSSTRWSSYNPSSVMLTQDNYYTFTPNFMSQPVPPPPSPATPGVPPEDGFPEIRIKEKEMLANFIVKWCETEDGNRFASSLKEIKIQEKNFDLPGKGVHEVQAGSTCTATVDLGPPPEKCGTTKDKGIFCDQSYVVDWTVNPTVQFDEEDLKSEANVTGQSTDVAAGWPGVEVVNKYQMTRKDGKMDLEFCDPGRIFDTYTYNNASPAPHAEGGNTGSSSYQFSPGYATPVGPAEPFRDCYRVSFNSHRFAKWASDDPVSVAGGIEKFIPLAWYMMDTEENQKYEEFVDDRGLVKRIEGELDETNQTNMDGMYHGNPGKNITWGHGGDYGTSTADSDVVWNNQWQWVRTLHYPEGEDESCPSCGSGYEEYHPGCDLPTSKSGISAERIETPRSVFARTLIVEDTLHGEAKEHTEDLSYYMRENEYGNDRVSFFIPSTMFEFSPTYKMFADYDLNCTGDNYEDVWCLASDVDKVQFLDVLDFNLIGGETNVRAPWSRDYEDQGATDPNTGEPINVVKGGSAYHVDTTSSRFEITAVVHYYDLSFFEPGTPEYQRAEHANQIIAAYTSTINEILNAVSDGSFGYYTNLIGGTTYTSKYRHWGSTMNPQIFNGGQYTNKDGQDMTLRDPMYDYPKLQLTPNILNGYVNGNKVVTPASIVLDNHRLNGYFDIWDAAKSQGSELWTDGVLHEYIPDINISSGSKLQSVLERGKGTNERWYTEDFEGIKVCVIRGSVDLPAIRSNPATVYERLSDFRSSMNTWSPQMLHPIIEADGGTGLRGSGDLVVIEDGSVGAGTYLDIPGSTIYPGGIDSPLGLSEWSISYKPDLFGVRGSVFDLS